MGQNNFFNLFKKLSKNEAYQNKIVKKLVILLGGPASGKSFIADLFVSRHGYRKAISDEYFEAIRKKKENTDKINVSIQNPEQKNDYVWSAVKNDQRIEHYLKNGYPIVTEKTGQNYGTIASLKKLAESYGYQVYCIYVEADINTALQRNKNRPNRSLSDDNELISTHMKAKQNVDPSEKGIGFSGLFGNNFFLVRSEDTDESKEEILRITDVINQ